MLLYSLWTQEDLEEFIKTLELAHATGTTSVTTPSGGSQSFRSRGEIKGTLRELYDALSRHTGINYRTGGRPRQVEAISRNGYGRMMRFGRNPFGC